MYKLCCYVPVKDIDVVKQALFNAGAGRLGAYDCCAWQTLGQGQFRPLQNSQPHIGTHGQIECVQEYKLEMMCADDVIAAVITALKTAHPYETPAYDIVKL